MKLDAAKSSKTFSFKFRDNALNQRLLDELRRAGVQHEIDDRGAISYSAADEEIVEGEIIPKIRQSVFSDWQVVCCPKDWADRYREYMERKRIRYVEEESDGKPEFLIAGKARPHSWKI